MARAVREGWITSVEWVPSHDKKPSWSANDPQHTQHARDVHKCADKLATSVASDLQGERDMLIYEARVNSAVEWTEFHLARLHIAARAFVKQYDPSSLDEEDLIAASTEDS